jgi:preprotein translocase subunit SecF
MFRIFANANYPFLEWRQRAYVVSAVILALGIGAMVFNVAQRGSWMNYGVDFAGGTMVHVAFQETTTEEAIRSATAAAGIPVAQVTRFGGATEFVIRMPEVDPTRERDAADLVRAALGDEFGVGTFEVIRTEAVGPRVGAELQQRALLAILISFGLTLIYLWIRFEWRFGVASIIATAHDILVTLGILALLWMEISVGTVAAFLTIVGYSLNDTIVVFDRAREDLSKMRGKKNYMAALTSAINNTLPRTVLTSGTTLLTLFSLYIFGGAVIRDFALVLILGVAIGTYSSIFVASPALKVIEDRWPHEAPKKRSSSRRRRKEKEEAATSA